jgi:hypothetical protein
LFLFCGWTTIHHRFGAIIFVPVMLVFNHGTDFNRERVKTQKQTKKQTNNREKRKQKSP